MVDDDVLVRYILADTVALDADGIAESQTPASGGAQNLTLDGTLTSGGTATFNSGRIVTIASVGNDLARTFTVTGTDVNGNSQTETIAGPNATTSTGTKYFKTVTQVSVDDDTAGAITVGINNSAADVIFAGPLRLKGVLLTNSAAAGTIPVVKTSPTGSNAFTLTTVADATVQTDWFVPGNGVLIREGAYITYTGGSSATFTSLLVSYA